MDSLTIDCDTCAVRGPACDGCVISVLMGHPDEAPMVLDDDERRALTALAGHGLLPPLRLAPPGAGPGVAHGRQASG
ncbi:hypothetical protein [Auraticoccus cholistanensis]|nr:hypothetical protein [Auraticoccus cholistanensis]